MSAAAVASRGQPLSQERDYNHATDSEYKRLRDLADQAYKKRQQLSQQSQNAYKNGDRSGAHTLSEQAKEQLQVAEKYNLQAAEFVFTQNNADSSSNEIDLHGLYTKEAVWILQKRIAAAVSARESVLKVIVGKGLHSANGIAKIKPAVEDLCQQANLPNYVDSKNAGVLVIELQNASVPASWSSTDYATYAHGVPSKPQASHQAQQHQYTGQQQPQYQQQQQSQYQQQQSNYQQQQQQQQSQSQAGNNDLLSTLLGLLCTCVRKNL
ncbi:Smr domain-containing protein [Lachancea thermotolerans CBS 6340]|uniref:KLTH0H04334p n=1 Tax=Lachancea thermotolerans (strain ATCC 56472 / CBS 6340 / NRRL Y-8284) TaxID=559295 RepID=C5E2E8_LACTC|nr:KLTH0H04334p [Lachancea thermotolerans CBS 6340]CAR30209.1 KLTH0H04334p [Lachancea thermotolerans CBS 6340]